MVAFSKNLNSSYSNKQNGGSVGLYDIAYLLKNGFTGHQIKGEHHAKSLSPETYGQTMRYMGPQTRLDIKLDENMKPKKEYEPLNIADFHSYEHDVAYQKAYKSI
jgi:hypothetical protein